jgi:signal transduction histidine kinase/DNA-binding response OmpR family regulator/putative methionine-R-sulfoxide reductase with GAF domain
MRIKTKLIIGFSLLLLLLLGITSFGYASLSQMNKSMNHFVDNRFEKVIIAVNVRGEINAASRQINDIILGEQESEEGIKEIIARLTDAGKQFEALYQMDLTSDEQQLIEEIKQSSENFATTLAQFIELVNKTEMDAAKTFYTDNLREEQRSVVDYMDVLVAFQKTELKKETDTNKKLYNQSVRMVAALTIVGLLLGLAIVTWIFPSITKGLNLLGRMADRFGRGRLRGFTRFEITSTDELGVLAKVFKQIALDLQVKNEREALLSGIQQRQGRIDAQKARVTELLQQNSDVKQVAQAFISEFAPVLGASYGLLYLTESFATGGHMELSGAYAAGGEKSSDQAAPAVIRSGEGLTGQCMKDAKQIIMQDVPEGYLKIRSGLGETAPKAHLIQPILHDDEVIGVIELASLSVFDSESLELLDSLCDNFGSIVNNIRSRQRVEELLRESQAMTEELQSQSEELICQQEELRETNDKLEIQRNDLRKSEQQLQQQQEELELANQQLTVKTQSLEENVERVELQNSQIAKANSELERQALQLALSSKYKSEFLANMSHELRTPLNSLLILSEFLAENKEGNLTDKQQEYLKTIHYSGNDLLKMIDEILDLSKVDAGKMDIHPEWMVLNDMSNFLEHMYTPMASQKNLTLSIECDSDIPNAIWTDGHRLKQVLRNLISNAIKFTDSGEITLMMRRPNEEEKKHEAWQEMIPYLAFSVIDSGIGIAHDKSELIFEAFRQADGTTSRKYGGTGLGLTISRELARLLGGWIHLESEVGKGSTFTLVIPERLHDQVIQPEEFAEPYTYDLAAAASESIYNMNSNDNKEKDNNINDLQDDRDSITEKDKVILIVEDDVNFAKVLMEMARSRGFKSIVATQGDAGIALAISLKPNAVILDIQLPVTDGWSVLNELKRNPDTRHIPVHVVSVMEHSSQGLRMGAIDHLQKPATRDQLEKVFMNINQVLDNKPKQLLLIEQENELRDNLTQLIMHDDVTVTAVPDARIGWMKLQEEHYDCIVLDSSLPDGASLEFLERIQESSELSKIPIVLHGGHDDGDEGIARKIRQVADNIILKDVKSPERLLEETTLFLHRVEAQLPEDKRELLKKLHQSEQTFENKKILLVDDDVRNIFALSSVLESRQMSVVYAENGVEALNRLAGEPDIDLVLMDIMMPEMDGYEAMKRIRENPSWSKLPIIALTAKAMKDDRNKCIEAGASEYITKPINTDQLLSLMRVWLYR